MKKSAPTQLSYNSFCICLCLALSGLMLVMGCEVSRKKTYNNEELRPEKEKLPYDFDNPSDRYFLGEDLEEISGLSWYGTDQLACVQDESGRVFIYDIEQDKITNRMKFGKSGDYEGVEWVEDSLYVIKSDGTLLSFVPTDPDPEIVAAEIPFAGEVDIEGLGYDPTTKYLLLAAKSVRDTLDELVKDKVVYAFDPARQQLLSEPFLTIKQETLEAFVTRYRKKESKNEKGEAKITFKPSGIAVHPITGHTYLIASDGKKLLVLNRQGEIIAGVQFSPRMLKQPEGICFSPEGDLYISSEGRGEDGYILKFNYQQGDMDE